MMESKTNRFKHDYVSQVSAPVRVLDFQPLRSHWTVDPASPVHEKIAQYRKVPSRFVK